MVQELEAMGARVIPVFAGGLDFSNQSMHYEEGQEPVTCRVPR